MTGWLLVALGLTWVALIACVPRARRSARREEALTAATSVTTDGAGERPVTARVPAAIELDQDVEPTNVGASANGGALASAGAPFPVEPIRPVVVKQIIYDEDASVDEPTHASPLFLVTGTARTDAGLRRKRNEDSVLALDDHGLFVVADGMGGYHGGEVASSLAVTTIEEAFNTRTFQGSRDESIPIRASELARAIQMANDAILGRAEADPQFKGMGTTICAARFSPDKQRLYVAHVGDSRVYCLRQGRLAQMTSDHTMADFGVTGPGANHLSRAVGVWPTVPVDIILGTPRAGDVYLLCSDGLTKMVADADIERILAECEPRQAAQELVDAAKEHGGKDNISVVVVSIAAPNALPKPPPGATSSARVHTARPSAPPVALRQARS